MKLNGNGFRWCCLILMSLWLVLQVPSPVRSEPSYLPDEVLSFADYLYQKDDYSLALLEYERFWVHFPEHPRAWEAQRGKARCLFWRGAYREALSEFQALAVEFPRSHIGHEAALMAARCYLLLEENDVATAIYSRMLQQHSFEDLTTTARFDLAWFYMNLSSWEDSRRQFEELARDGAFTEAAERIVQRLATAQELPMKSPVASGVLSGLLPGLGQLYCGQYKDAGLAFLLNSVFAFSAYEAFDNDLNVLGGLITLVGLGFYGGNIYNAVNHAHKINTRRKHEFVRDVWRESEVSLALPLQEKRWLGLMLSIPF